MTKHDEMYEELDRIEKRIIAIKLEVERRNKIISNLSKEQHKRRKEDE